MYHCFIEQRIDVIADDNDHSSIILKNFLPKKIQELD